ncbi:MULTISPECIES: hemerythrin domain-containing protein [Streptomyces]|uniref:hemerythrin domain-containing protein n=1 Tax=Streptomyces TaxID=1883 RepID=UPI000F7AC845|nr:MULTISPECIES: hemerythrin domain-containing protein [Streptomyces]MBX4177937.1 hemerythrin domain-containing protein [Streptomyces geysiriensis]NUV96961.1 hemerythrin domain-containing protein [Streptomyces sp. KAI 90]RSS86334.1 hemerythrin domain-containing protein [Streptomyces sp. WAC02707]
MSDPAQSPGARMYEEFVAIHAVLRRGTRLVVDAYERLADGHDTDTATLVDAGRWLLAFTHAHHKAEDDLFWPVLEALYPDARAQLKELSDDHVVLDRRLNALETAIDALDEATQAGRATGGTDGARAGAEAARQVHQVLDGHLTAEEAVVEDLFPGVPADDIDRLREAFVQGSPRFGLHFMFGLLDDPEPARGRDLLTENFPPQLRAAGPRLISQYEAGIQGLRGGPGGDSGRPVTSAGPRSS